jgi:hypothetical protein
MFDVVHLPEDEERLSRLTTLANRTGVELDYSLPAVRHSQPAMGCLQSHRNLIERAMLQQRPFLAVLEDDAEWDETNDSLIRSWTPPNVPWDMLYLGGQFIQEWNEHSQSPWRCGSILTTHAYILHSSCFERVIADLNRIVSGEWPFMTIDQYYSCFIHTTQRSFLHDPPLIRQQSGYSHIEQTMVNYDMVLRPQDPIRPFSVDLTVEPAVWPAVTIVTPTIPSRKNWLRFMALPCVLHQDYPGVIEWIIVDEQEWKAPEPKQLQHPQLAGSSLRHVILEKQEKSPPITIAQKRNVGCQLATHSIIVHFDDDDFYPPHSIRLRVQALLQNEAHSCVGCTTLLSHSVHDRCSYEIGPNRTLFEASMAYHKSFWMSQPFEPRLSRGEGFSLLDRRHTQCLDLTDRAAVMVCLFHGDNVTGSIRQHGDPQKKNDFCWTLFSEPVKHYLRALEAIHGSCRESAVSGVSTSVSMQRH